jgi:PKD repeat protein
MTRGLAILPLALLALCLLPVDGAGAAWTEPIQISPVAEAASEPQIAIDAAGNTTAIWVTGSAGSRSVRSSFRPAGGSWEAPFTRMTSTHDCHSPRLAVNHAGAADLVAECEKPSPSLWSAYRPSTSWNGSLEIPSSASGKAPRVAIDASGNVTVVWATGTVVHSAFRAAAGTVQTDAGQLSTSSKQAFEPNVAMSPDGYAFAVWREKREESGADPVIDVRISRRQGAAAWIASSRLTPNFGSGSTNPVASGEPQIDVNAQGGRMVAWGLGGTTMEERTATSDLGGYAEPSTKLSEASAFVEAPRIAIDDEVRGIATWRSFEGGIFQVKAATTPFSNGAWSSPTTLSGPGGSIGTEPTVAADGVGDAVVAFMIGGVVSASYRPASGSLTAAVPVSNAAHGGPFLSPVTAIGDGGDALVAWTSANVAPSHIALAVDDVTPPALSDLGAPQSVEVGQTANLSVNAKDAWSPVTVTWDFGDGATATGNAVTHVYSNTGTKTVTVTATDAVGNSTSQTRAISVTPRPGEGPGGGTPKPLALTASVVKQPWRKIFKAKAIKLHCELSAAGTCTATATVGAAVARRIGLKVPKRAKTVTIGSGSAQLGAGRAAIVKVRLTGKARAAIEDATKPVAVALSITGTAPGPEPASSSTTLKVKIKRP